MNNKFTLALLALAISIPFSLTAHAASPDEDGFRSQVERAVTQLDDGVLVTLTTENAEFVAKLQERAASKTPKHEEVELLVTNLDNGVQISITSDDEDFVEKIQKRAERKKFGKKRRGGKRGQGKRMGQFGPQE